MSEPHTAPPQAADPHTKASIILEIDRLRWNAEDLLLISSELALKEAAEPDAGRAMALSMARREVSRLAADYAHAATRLSFEASVALEGNDK